MNQGLNEFLARDTYRELLRARENDRRANLAGPRLKGARLWVARMLMRLGTALAGPDVARLADEC
jgi:hypothetical protein